MTRPAPRQDLERRATRVAERVEQMRRRMDKAKDKRARGRTDEGLGGADVELQAALVNALKKEDSKVVAAEAKRRKGDRAKAVGDAGPEGGGAASAASALSGREGGTPRRGGP